MDTQKILSDLRAERERLNQAIAALEALDSTKQASPRPQGHAARQVTKQASPKQGNGRRRLSAAARKRISEAAKKRWAERRKTAKTV